MPSASHHYPFGTLPLRQLHPDCRLTVTIPAKDEVDFILQTLAALYEQTDDRGYRINPTTYEIILLANNCTDDTAVAAEAFRSRHPDFQLHVFEKHFPKDIACVGTARRLMMDSALTRYVAADKADGILSTTDADTQVHPEWVFQTLRTFERGAQAVGGRILVPATERTGSSERYRKYHLQDVTYRSLRACLESMIDPDPADPWPRHFQNYGPSTAATVAAYLRCGGMPPLQSLEDVGFFDALTAADITVTHNPLVRVYTSNRVSNRVDGTAFSHQLDEWADMNERQELRHVMGLENSRKMYKWKVSLRNAYQHGCPDNCDSLEAMATALNRSWATMKTDIKEATTFGRLLMDVEYTLDVCPKFNTTPIETAIRNLRTFTYSLRTQGQVG